MTQAKQDWLTDKRMPWPPNYAKVEIPRRIDMYALADVERGSSKRILPIEDPSRERSKT
jgi:hypothetical protein